MNEPEASYNPLTGLSTTPTEQVKAVYDYRSIADRQNGIDELIDLLAKKVVSLNAEVIELAKKVMELEQNTAIKFAKH